MGVLFDCLAAEELYVERGGLFVVCGREGSAGRFPEGGGGGGALLPAVDVDCGRILFPTPCWFKAAILAESEVN
jgi:hypothetical protein